MSKNEMKKDLDEDLYRALFARFIVNRSSSPIGNLPGDLGTNLFRNLDRSFSHNLIRELRVHAEE